jgi:hypothetical protein
MKITPYTINDIGFCSIRDLFPNVNGIGSLKFYVQTLRFSFANSIEVQDSVKEEEKVWRPQKFPRFF